MIRAVNAVRFSPDGLSLATAGDRGDLIIWTVSNTTPYLWYIPTTGETVAFPSLWFNRGRHLPLNSLNVVAQSDLLCQAITNSNFFVPKIHLHHTIRYILGIPVHCPVLKKMGGFTINFIVSGH